MRDQHWEKRAKHAESLLHGVRAGVFSAEEIEKHIGGYLDSNEIELIDLNEALEALDRIALRGDKAVCGDFRLVRLALIYGCDS